MNGQDNAGMVILNLKPETHYIIERTSALGAGDWQTTLEFDATATSSAQAVQLTEGWPMMFLRVRTR